MLNNLDTDNIIVDEVLLASNEKSDNTNCSQERNMVFSAFCFEKKATKRYKHKTLSKKPLRG